LLDILNINDAMTTNFNTVATKQKTDISWIKRPTYKVGNLPKIISLTYSPKLVCRGLELWGNPIMETKWEIWFEQTDQVVCSVYVCICVNQVYV